MKFAVGDKVVEKADVQAHSSYPVSEVVGILNGALLLTPWGDAYEGEIHHHNLLDEYGPGSRVWKTSITRHQESELYTPEEALAEARRLEAASSKLNQEFEAVQVQVSIKLAAAAQCIEEAAGIVAKHKKSFDDIIPECVPLYKALKQGGWSHSTMQCQVG